MIWKARTANKSLGGGVKYWKSHILYLILEKENKNVNRFWMYN